MSPYKQRLKEKAAQNRAAREAKRQEQIKYISQCAGLMPAKEIAKHLNCRPESVRRLASEFDISLAINHSEKLTEEDYQLIAALESDGMDDGTIIAKFECSLNELNRARKTYRI